MKIAIHQINTDRDDNHVAFLSFDNLVRFQKTSVIDCKIYDKVFEGDVDCDNLEGIYIKFNLDIPEGYAGRSLSVSDIVEIQESSNSTVTPGYYFCDSFGFKPVKFDSSLCSDADKDQESGKKITVLLVQPKKRPELIEIGSDLKSMQKVVGGDIEKYCPFEDEVALICNEEGKINGATLNRAIYDKNTHKMIDIIAGDFFIAYAPTESEHFLSLPDELAKKYKKLFYDPEAFFRVNNNIVAMPI